MTYEFVVLFRMARQPPKITLITQSFLLFVPLTVLVGQYLFWIRAGIGRMHSVSTYSTLIIVPTVALAGLFWAARREGGRPIAQVLAPVIGAIIGVCGVFLVTQLQFAHQTEQLQEDARAKFSPAMSKWREHDASQTKLRPYLVYGRQSEGR